MRTLALKSYGPLDSLMLLDLPVPEPKKGEVRIRVHASALNPADHKVALGTIKFLHARNFPMVLGYDFSGVIDAVGPDSKWKVGDAVFGFLPYGPFNRRGAFAEALIASAEEIALKPESVTHVQAAAAATPALTALQAMRDHGKLPTSGASVLITGASGGVGSIAIPLALKLGATVTAVGSGRGLDLAKKLGASTVLDRKSGDVFAKAQGPFDLVFDAAAGYRWSQWKSKLKAGGRYVTTLPSMSLLTDKILSLTSSSGVGFVNVKCKPADLEFIAQWMASGISVPVDSTIPVREVAKGLHRLERGEALGRIVVDVVGGWG